MVANHIGEEKNTENSSCKILSVITLYLYGTGSEILQ